MDRPAPGGASPPGPAASPEATSWRRRRPSRPCRCTPSRSWSAPSPCPCSRSARRSRCWRRRRSRVPLQELMPAHFTSPPALSWPLSAAWAAVANIAHTAEAMRAPFTALRVHVETSSPGWTAWTCVLDARRKSMGLRGYGASPGDVTAGGSRCGCRSERRLKNPAATPPLNVLSQAPARREASSRRRPRVSRGGGWRRGSDGPGARPPACPGRARARGPSGCESESTPGCRAPRRRRRTGGRSRVVRPA